VTMEKLEPLRSGIFSDRIKSELDVFMGPLNKRVAGGRVQMNIMGWEDVARNIVPYPPEGKSGFDKQIKRPWTNQGYALGRIFKEYGWPAFKEAVVMGGVQKYAVDPNGCFIPLAPGSIDIEAGIDIEAIYGHRELLIWGEPGTADDDFQKILSSTIGFATEYGNGNSMEVIIPVCTPGTWQKIEDIEFGRTTGMVIVTPHVTLWCEGLSVNRLQKMPYSKASVKMIEAIKIARSPEIQNIINR